MKIETLHEFKTTAKGYNRNILDYADRYRRYFICEYGAVENNRYISGVIMDNLVLYDETNSFENAIRELASYIYNRED